MNSLKINNLSHHFGHIQALENISLTVNRGELFGLVGPDGAGKSTLIRTVLGIYPKQMGEIEILGNEVQGEAQNVKTNTGYLSQQFSLYEDLTIDENIEFYAAIHNVKIYKDRRDELLAFTRLTTFRNRLAGKLSGGMKQKLALACTLIHKPEIIFLDEPTTGVDPISRRDFWKILFDLLKDGLTIFLTTPYMDEAERCHRVALINQGKILTISSPRELKKRVSLNILEIIPNNMETAIELLKNEIMIESVQLRGERLNCLFNPKNITEKELLDKIEQLSIEYQSVRVMEPDMENVFIYFMNKSKMETV